MIVAACAVLATGAAQAQPLTRLTNNVTIYGIVDSGVERVTDVGPARGSVTRLPTAASSISSRLGFRGAEDLGGGLWAQFVLESGFGVDAGTLNQGGRWFGRQSFVGLSDARYGTLSVGRQYDGVYHALIDSGILTANIYGPGSLDPYLAGARFDNTVAYQSSNLGGFTFGANYSFGRDAVGGCGGESATDAQACRAASGFAKYITEGWGVALGYGRQRGGVGGPAGLVRSDLTDDRATLNGFVRGSNWKLGAGWVGRDNEGVIATQQRSNLYWVEGSYGITPALALEAYLGQLHYGNALAGDRARLAVVRGVYSFSKRSAVYVMGARILNRGGSALSVSAGGPGSSPVAGQGQTGVMAGIRTTF